MELVLQSYINKDVVQGPGSREVRRGISLPFVSPT